MFNNKTDRLNYGNLLIPPTGFELTMAVATTYSLDLETLTAATIALGVHENTDSVIADNPVTLLHSLQKVSEKVVIFCESGQTKLPKTASPLVLLLEKMIAPVALTAQNGSFPSFHPKTWTLEYENTNGEKLYRFIILSRNLTFDRSWDVTFMMEGKKNTGVDKHVHPLISFLKYLEGWIRHDRDRQQKIVSSMQEALKGVKFELDRKEFGDFSIMPIGIGREGIDMTEDELLLDYPNTGQQNTFHELTIISPFLSKETIDYFNSDKFSLTGTRRKLFTRRTELPRIKDVANNFDVYVLKDTIVDGEGSLPEGEEFEPKRQDIHAKMYLRRKTSKNELYLGSMNASNSGVKRNVEMLVKLEIKNRHIDMDRLCKELFAGQEDDKSNPFEKVDLSHLSTMTEDKDEQDELVHTLKQVCRIKCCCQVISSGDEYQLQIHFDGDTLPDNVEISPLMAKGLNTHIAKSVIFNGLNILQLSEFFVVTVKGKESCMHRVILIPTQGIPQERDKSLVQGVIKDKKTFIEYVAMALGDDLLQLFGIEHKEHEYGHGSTRGQDTKVPALYEKMLRVAYEDRKKLLEINKIMEVIDDGSIITDEFRQMYDAFKFAMEL